MYITQMMKTQVMMIAEIIMMDGVEDVESGLADAFEGDLDAYWNID